MQEILKLQPDEIQIVFDAISDLVSQTHEQLAGVKTFNTDVASLIIKRDDLENEYIAHKLNLYGDYETSKRARAKISLEIKKTTRDIKQICADRLPLINTALVLSESAVRICSDPKKYVRAIKSLEMLEQQ